MTRRQAEHFRSWLEAHPELHSVRDGKVFSKVTVRDLSHGQSTRCCEVLGHHPAWEHGHLIYPTIWHIARYDCAAYLKEPGVRELFPELAAQRRGRSRR